MISLLDSIVTAAFWLSIGVLLPDSVQATIKGKLRAAIYPLIKRFKGKQDNDSSDNPSG